MISQHWFRLLLGALRQQAIIWANVDLVPCRRMASPGHNELKGIIKAHVWDNPMKTLFRSYPSSNQFEIWRKVRTISYKTYWWLFLHTWYLQQQTYYDMRGIHYCDAIMGTVASQITSLMIVYTTVYSDANQSKHQSSASLAFVWGIHRGPVNSPHKWPVTRKMFSFDDVIMN